MQAQTDMPPPPPFYEAVFKAGVRAGAAVRSSHPIQIFSDGEDDDYDPSTPRESRQPQGEPEPEMPGRSEPSESDQTSRPNEGESDDRDNEGESPEHTDTDPYGDPTESQADVEVTAHTEEVTIVDSPDKSKGNGEAMANNPEASATTHDTTPATTTEAARNVSQEQKSEDENSP